jgi:hypothetical protein
MKMQRTGPRRIFLLTPVQWLISIGIAFILSLVTWQQSAGFSGWLTFGVALATFTLFHAAFAASRVLCMPHIAILLSTLQYFFAAWISYLWPPTNPTYDIGTRFAEYLSYAGPAVAASAVGWGLSLLFVSPTKKKQFTPEARLLFIFDVLFGIGIIALVLSRFIDIESINFAILLLRNLRYVGVFGRMLVRGPGWQWRLAVLLALETILAAGGGMFHELLLWIMWAFVIWIFSSRPRPASVIAVLLFAIISLPALQESKWRLREGGVRSDDPWAEYEANRPDETAIQRTGRWLRYFGSALEQTATLNLEPQFISDIAVRYNQGWIIDRILGVVPEVEPFAEGETIKTAFTDALVPRFIDPYKWIAGGRYMMARYAGMDLGETTSMNVGYVGEMYINFGQRWGIIGCGIYALVLGLLFRVLCWWGYKNPLVLAFVPYLLYAAGKSEEDIGFIVNWLAKAGMIMLVVLAVARLLVRKGETAVKRPALRQLTVEPS